MVVGERGEASAKGIWRVGLGCQCDGDSRVLFTPRLGFSDRCRMTASRSGIASSRCSSASPAHSTCSLNVKFSPSTGSDEFDSAGSTGDTAEYVALAPSLGDGGEGVSANRDAARPLGSERGDGVLAGFGSWTRSRLRAADGLFAIRDGERPSTEGGGRGGVLRARWDDTS